MRIGVPKEIKSQEFRVGLIPSSVRELVSNGHNVIVETNAGLGVGFTDEDYRNAGASIYDNAPEVFHKTDMIIKVKEPQLNECKLLKDGQILFTFLHLAPDPQQTKGLLDSGCIAVAYETVTSNTGGLPLLAPMSEVAGRMSIQAGARSLEKAHGGKGVLLGGVPGVPAAKVTVIGGGVVGSNAVRIAMGMGADVTVLDKSLPCLRALDNQFGSRLNTVYATQDMIERYILSSDLIIGAVLVPGGSAPKLITRDMLSQIGDGTVLVDVSIDQGGCFETSMPTTHAEPTYVVDGVVHYCVANMPGAAPLTSNYALNNVTLPFALDLANKGLKKALIDDKHLRNGLNIFQGKVTHKAVAESLGYNYVEPEEVLNVETALN
jgi:alanine dehydrogenase